MDTIDNIKEIILNLWNDIKQAFNTIWNNIKPIALKLVKFQKAKKYVSCYNHTKSKRIKKKQLKAIKLCLE